MGHSLSWQSSCLLSKRSQVRILLGAPPTLIIAQSVDPSADGLLSKRSQVRIPPDPPRQNFPIFARPIRPREARKGMGTLAGSKFAALYKNIFDCFIKNNYQSHTINMYEKSMALLIVSVAVAFSLANSVFAQSQYSSPINHYSFTFPSGWEEIPKSVIDQYTDEVVRQTQGERVEYAAGFQLAEKDYFQYPYILVKEHDINTPSYSEIERTFNDSDYESMVQEKTAEYSELLTNATLEKPFVDKEQDIIFMNIQLDVTGVGKVSGLTAIFLGKQGITQVNFYAISSEYSRWLPVFNSIIDSFKFDAAYAYDPAEAVKNDSSSLFEGVAEKGLSGAIIGGIIGLVVALTGWGLRKKKGKDAPQ